MLPDDGPTAERLLDARRRLDNVNDLLVELFAASLVVCGGRSNMRKVVSELRVIAASLDYLRGDSR